MSVAQWFKQFCDNINFQSTYPISNRYRQITKRLNIDYWGNDSDIYHSRYVGSVGRNTAAITSSDIDMVFQLPYETYVKFSNYSSNGQSALLQEVKRSIEKTFSITSLKADGQVIVVPFADGITFEVVPVFENTDGSFTYPNSLGGGFWKITNPIPEIQAIRNRNNACNGNLVRLCRMTRQWRDAWNVPISGLLIDALAYQFMATYQYREKSFLYYDFMNRDFFKWLASQSREKEYWLAPGSSQRVYGKGLFQYKATRCLNLSQEAIDHELAKPSRVYSARAKWREVFGQKFPRY